MSAFVLSAAFLLLAGQPPAVTPTQASAPAKPEPKMICKYEFATGSHIHKVKVCRPENEMADDIDTKLQREMSKNGDQRTPQGGLMISPGSGIGN
jgi:hypothetical protein